MDEPIFSIVIPTRNRGRELHYTLRTCLEQDYAQRGGEFEIVVSDNDSQDDIRGVVESFGSSRVQYVRTGRYLSMTDSWEFAVSHARGRYVGVVGTDDGLLFNALSRVYDVIAKSGADAVTFQGAYYYWPTCPDPALKNTLRVPSFVFREGVQSGESLIREALSTLYYGRLPCMLNSFCSVELLERARRRCGRVFASYAPDVYAGFLLGALAQRLFVLNRIMLVGAVSGGSTGGNAYVDPTGPTMSEHLSRFSESRRLEGFPVFPFAASYIADCAIQALEAVDVENPRRLVDMRSVLSYCFRQALALQDSEQRGAAMEALRKYVKDHPEYLAFWRRLSARRLRWSLEERVPLAVRRAAQVALHFVGRGSGVLANEVLSCEPLGIHNVYDAAKYLTAHVGSRA